MSCSLPSSDPPARDVRWRSRASAGYAPLLLLTVLLSACAVRPPAPGAPDPQATWAARQVQLAGLGGWRLVGRIGIVSAEEGGAATVHWRQQGPSYEITLFGPFGRGLARLYGDAGEAVLETPEREPLQAADAEALFAEQLGWRVPIEPLRHWVLGLAGRGDEIELDDYGRLASVTRDGWEVFFLAYDPVDGIELPRRLYLRRSGLGIKFAVHEWALQWRANARPPSGDAG